VDAAARRSFEKEARPSSRRVRGRPGGGCHSKAGARVGDYVEGEERKISVIGKDKIIAEGTVIDAGAIV